jgi:integrase
MFPSSIGSPLEPRNLYRNFQEILRKTGLPRIRFHDLRHTAATLMLEQGVHPKAVQERLGHANILMTLGTYSHVLPDIQEEAADRLDRLFSKEKDTDAAEIFWDDEVLVPNRGSKHV